MNLIELIEKKLAYITLGLAILIVLILILTIIMMIKQSKLRNKYNKFMQGASGKELESILIERFTDIDKLKQASSSLHNEIDLINENLLSTVQKVGVVKYDAFNEMGGKLSFALALLDKNNDGFIMNSVHSSREGCYTYLKEIIKGESFLELSKEEKNALNHAIKSDNFME
jgi:hypothetical protein